jgi:hypothetical protein
MPNHLKALKSIFKAVLVVLAFSGTAQALSQFLK